MSAKTKSWSWGCSEALCTYRFAVDTVAATAAAGAYDATTSATQNSGTGTYYLHVQAKDAAGNESAVVHVSAELDNTAPAVPSGLALVTPATSPGNTAAPVIQVSGVTAGDTVSIYTDSGCAAPSLKGSGSAAGATIQIISNALAEGTYSFFAKAADAKESISRL